MFHNKNVAAKAAIMEKGLCARAAHRFFFKVCMPLKENKHINKYIYIYMYQIPNMFGISYYAYTE